MSGRTTLLVTVVAIALWLALGDAAEASSHCRGLDPRACEAAHHGPLVPIVAAALAGLAAVGAGVAGAMGATTAAVEAARTAAGTAARSVPLLDVSPPSEDATAGPSPEPPALEPVEVPIDEDELLEWLTAEIANLPLDGQARDAVDEALTAAAGGDVSGATESTGEAETNEAGPTAQDEDTDTTPPPPGHETAVRIGDLAGEVADAVESIGEELEDLPIDDEAKEAIKERLDEIGETAGKVRDGAKTAQEYIEVLDENLDRTRRMGIDERSRDFLGWFRVTFRAIGELAEDFVDAAVKPVTALFGDKADKVEELLHDAVPIKEFGDDLSKFPTSAAHHAIGASQRNQIDEAQRSWGGAEPDPDDLRDMYRFPAPR